MNKSGIIIEKVPYDRKVVVIPMPNLANSLRVKNIEGSVFRIALQDKKRVEIGEVVENEDVLEIEIGSKLELDAENVINIIINPTDDKYRETDYLFLNFYEMMKSLTNSL